MLVWPRDLLFRLFPLWQDWDLKQCTFSILHFAIFCANSRQISGSKFKHKLTFYSYTVFSLEYMSYCLHSVIIIFCLNMFWFLHRIFDYTYTRVYSIVLSLCNSIPRIGIQFSYTLFDDMHRKLYRRLILINRVLMIVNSWFFPYLTLIWIFSIFPSFFESTKYLIRGRL